MATHGGERMPITKPVCIYVHSRAARGIVSKILKAAGVKVGAGGDVTYDAAGRDGGDAAYRGSFTKAQSDRFFALLKQALNASGIEAYCDGW